MYNHCAWESVVETHQQIHSTAAQASGCGKSQEDDLTVEVYEAVLRV